MFSNPTVFVLGAGASWHYGYPTGEDLVERVSTQADLLGDFFTYGFNSGSGNQPNFVRRRRSRDEPLVNDDWQAASLEAYVLSSRLRQVNPTLIDYFLAQNEELQDIGRLAIALVIFACEYEQKRVGGNPNHLIRHQRKLLQGTATLNDPKPGCNAFGDDWLRFVLYKITSDCRASADLLENRVNFITFNYDASLERRLSAGLNNISRFDDEHIEEFLGGDRIIHVYGGIRKFDDKDWNEIATDLSIKANLVGHLDSVLMLDRVYPASLGIRTIDGDDKIKNSAAISATNAAISSAVKAYILGFGFDEANVQRIGLSSLGPRGVIPRTIFFTNFGGHNRVAAAAGRALIGNRSEFVRPQNPIREFDAHYGNANRHYRYEMSLKNVYDAFAEDFELLESV